jgi:hypothetical protein
MLESRLSSAPSRWANSGDFLQPLKFSLPGHHSEVQVLLITLDHVLFPTGSGGFLIHLGPDTSIKRPYFPCHIWFCLCINNESRHHHNTAIYGLHYSSTYRMTSSICPFVFIRQEVELTTMVMVRSRIQKRLNQS